ncbi:MAG: hypothetical protein IJ545_06690 [Alphaproteobacteria bacterium]|nr:hypothetical protein [Alphaproteobacteria bacterium]
MAGWQKWEKFTRPKQPSQPQESAEEQPVSPKKEEKKKKPVVLNSFEDLASAEIDETTEVKIPAGKRKQRKNDQSRNREQRNFDNKHNREDKRPNQRRKKMTEETFDTSRYKAEEDFIKSFEAEHGNIDEVAKTKEGQEKIKAAWHTYQENKNRGGSDRGGAEETGDREMRVSQGEPAPASDEHKEENTDWRKTKGEAWKAWCENKDNHNSTAYTYDPDSEASGLKFDVFKDAEKKEKLATIEYTSPNNVSIDNDDGKVPDLEFFNQLVKDAKESGYKKISFNGEMTPEFKTKLAVACLANDMPTKGFEEQINIENLPDKGASLGDDLKKKIGYHNKYQTLQKAAEAYKSNPENKDKPYKIKEDLSAEDAAIMYAACTNAGIQVEGINDVNKETRGMFILPEKDKKLMPEDVQTAVKEFNSALKKDDFKKIRSIINDRKNPVKDEDKATADRFRNVDRARGFMSTLNKSEEGQKLRRELVSEAGAEDKDILALIKTMERQDAANKNDNNMRRLFTKAEREEFAANPENADKQKVEKFKKHFEEHRVTLQNEAQEVNKKNPSFYAVAREKFLHTNN